MRETYSNRDGLFSQDGSQEKFYSKCGEHSRGQKVMIAGRLGTGRGGKPGKMAIDGLQSAAML